MERWRHRSFEKPPKQSHRLPPNPTTCMRGKFERSRHASTSPAKREDSSSALIDRDNFAQRAGRNICRILCFAPRGRQDRAFGGIEGGRIVDVAQIRTLIFAGMLLKILKSLVRYARGDSPSSHLGAPAVRPMLALTSSAWAWALGESFKSGCVRQRSRLLMRSPSVAKCGWQRRRAYVPFVTSIGRFRTRTRHGGERTQPVVKARWREPASIAVAFISAAPRKASTGRARCRRLAPALASVARKKYRATGTLACFARPLSSRVPGLESHESGSSRRLLFWSGAVVVLRDQRDLPGNRPMRRFGVGADARD